MYWIGRLWRLNIDDPKASTRMIQLLAITTSLLYWLSIELNTIDLPDKTISCKRFKNTNKRVEDII